MYRVFLADDEPWVVLGLKNLIDWGANRFVICGEALDGEKAWERIARLRPDLVITDIRMPGLSGLELMARLKEEKIHSKIVVISGYSDFEYARRALQNGCSDYLVKPVYEENLVQCLARIRESLETEPLMEQGEENDSEYLSEKRMAEKMVLYITEHYREVSLQMMEKEFCLGGSTISSIIKRNTGKNYSEHLLDIRISIAEKLLRSSKESIANIAEQVGYNDYFYFVKVFKKATGVSPSQFRRNL